MKLIEAGEVINTHGLKGGLKIKSFLEVSDIYDNLDELHLRYKSGKIVIQEIRTVKRRGKCVFVNFQKINRIEQAKLLVGSTVLIPADKLPPLEEGEYYFHEIIGLKVFTEQGEFIGEIKEILPTGSNDVYIVQGAKKEVLIPAIAEVIKSINITEGKMTVNLLEGL